MIVSTIIYINIRTLVFWITVLSLALDNQNLKVPVIYLQLLLHCLFPFIPTTTLFRSCLHHFINLFTSFSVFSFLFPFLTHCGWHCHINISKIMISFSTSLFMLFLFWEDSSSTSAYIFRCSTSFKNQLKFHFLLTTGHIYLKWAPLENIGQLVSVTFSHLDSWYPVIIEC